MSALLVLRDAVLSGVDVPHELHEEIRRELGYKTSPSAEGIAYGMECLRSTLRQRTNPGTGYAPVEIPLWEFDHPDITTLYTQLGCVDDPQRYVQYIHAVQRTNAEIAALSIQLELEASRVLGEHHERETQALVAEGVIRELIQVPRASNISFWANLRISHEWTTDEDFSAGPFPQGMFQYLFTHPGEYGPTTLENRVQVWWWPENREFFEAHVREDYRHVLDEQLQAEMTRMAPRIQQFQREVATRNVRRTEAKSYRDQLMELGQRLIQETPRDPRDP